MTRHYITEQIRQKKSYLCIGLDTDLSRIPPHLLSEPDPVFAFNKAIIDATRDLCVAYKLNTAFYESRGAKGWESMEQTVRYIGDEHFRIADAKRGDIGNTSEQYAKAFFETLPFDAVTVAPYMGEDSVKPFLEFKGKWTILLGLTSNRGAKDFELLHTGGEYLYEKVIETACTWGTEDHLMFVVGATQAGQLKTVRKLAPHYFCLVPGVGAQGGSLHEVSSEGMTKDVGMLVNVSRGIIYAGNHEDFALKARLEAEKYQQEMAGYL